MAPADSQPQHADIFEALDELHKTMMAATPAPWIPMTVETGGRMTATEVICSFPQPTAPIAVDDDPDPPMPPNELDIRFEQATGTGALPEFFVSTERTNYQELDDDSFMGCVEILDENGRPIAYISQVASATQMMEPCISPQAMESSAQLRANDDQDDTMGQQFDNSLEMGGAEEWFRDKLRVR